MDNIILHILLYLNIISFLLGYLLARFGLINNIDTNKIKNKEKNNISKSNDIVIDDKKVIIDINTKNLEKKYDSLGDTQEKKNDISNSIDKLKKLKR
jgi:hypothetical protein